MELNSKNSFRPQVSSGFMNLVSPRVYEPPETNLSCRTHGEFPIQICIFESCKARLLCQKCVSTHPINHKANILNYSQVMEQDIFNRIEQEIVFNLQSDQKKEVYTKFLNQLKATLNDIGKRIDKTLNAIYTNIQEKTLSNFPQPLYSTEEWERVKKALIEKRTEVSRMDYKKNVKPLEDFINAYSRATVSLSDSENEKDLKNLPDVKFEITKLPVIDQELVDETVKNLRKILNNLYLNISQQISFISTPEENVIRSQTHIQNHNDLSLGVTPRFFASPRKGSAAVNSITSFKDKVVVRSSPLTPDKNGEFLKNENILNEEKNTGVEASFCL